MKKILILSITLLLLIFGFLMCFKSINVGSIKIESINDIKNMSNNLDVKLGEADKIWAQDYPEAINKLEEAIKNLNINKKQYESKKISEEDQEGLFTTYLKEYKSEALMVSLGRHAKENKLKDLRIDLKTTGTEDIYDVNLILIGPYESVYNFIYSIEGDDELKFEVKNLKVEPYTIKETTTISKENEPSSTNTYNPYDEIDSITFQDTITTKTSQENSANNGNDGNTTGDEKNTNQTNSRTEVIYDPKNVQAEFTIEDISINFD